MAPRKVLRVPIDAPRDLTAKLESLPCQPTKSGSVILFWQVGTVILSSRRNTYQFTGRQVRFGTLLFAAGLAVPALAAWDNSLGLPFAMPGFWHSQRAAVTDDEAAFPPMDRTTDAAWEVVGAKVARAVRPMTE